MEINDNFIFLKDRITEMLFDYTIDIYRAPISNTKILTIEYLANLQDVKNGDTHKGKLNAIIEELRMSFKEDPVIESIFTSDERAYIVKKISNEKTSSKGVMYLKNRLGCGVYFKQLCSCLEKTILDPSKKETLESLTKILVSELKSLRYSYQYIYYTAKHSVPTNNVSKDLETFLKNFSLQRKKYIVSFAANITEESERELWKGIEELLPDGINNVTDDSYIGKAKDKFKKELPQYELNDDVQLCSFNNISAMDRFDAAEYASYIFDFFTRTYFLLLNEPKSLLIPKCIVSEITNSSQNENSQLFCIDCWTQRHRIIKPKEKQNLFLIEHSRHVLRTIFVKTKGIDELDRLFRAMDLHNSSLQTNNYQTSFISLWSALEVLCNGSKNITEILNACLELNYIPRLINNLKKNLEDVDNDWFRSRINQNQNITVDEYLCSILLRSSFKKERTEWEEKFSKLPILISKIDYFKNLNGKRNLYEEIKRYGNRVSLHVKRMNRTRNRIVHAGVSPKDIQALGEHLHMYLDVLFEEILRYFESGSYSRVEDVITAIIYEHDIYMNLIKNTKNIDNPEFIQIILRQKFNNNIN